MGRADLAIASGMLTTGLLAGIVVADPLGRTQGPIAGPDRVADACTRDRASPAESCGGCHPAIHDQWRKSAHADAFDDPLFRAEYDPWPATFCADCHAAGRARHDHDPHDGVDCSSCHPPRASEDPAWTDGVSMCAGCHQFDFPAAPFGRHGTYDPADPLQDTVHEWRDSQAARRGRTCVDCHMPATGEGPSRSHHLIDTHDPRLLARALTVDARAHRAPEGIELRLRLTPDQVGHRVPTGDMFRRLRVTAAVDGAPPQVKWLGRFFAQAPASDDRGFRLRPVLDDRVPASDEEPAVDLRFVLPDRGAHRVTWAIDLYRMPPEQAAERGLDDSKVRAPMLAGEVAVEDLEPPRSL